MVRVEAHGTPPAPCGRPCVQGAQPARGARFDLDQDDVRTLLDDVIDLGLRARRIARPVSSRASVPGAEGRRFAAPARPPAQRAHLRSPSRDRRLARGPPARCQGLPIRDRHRPAPACTGDRRPRPRSERPCTAKKLPSLLSSRGTNRTAENPARAARGSVHDLVAFFPDATPRTPGCAHRTTRWQIWNVPRRSTVRPAVRWCRLRRYDGAEDLSRSVRARYVGPHGAYARVLHTVRSELWRGITGEAPSPTPMSAR